LDNHNKFLHVKSFPTPDSKIIVRPNCDTLYSLAFLDLGRDAVIVSMPDTDGRFYVMQIVDGWTNTFASKGKRTTGTGAQEFFFIGPFWQGPTELEGKTTLRSPTNIVGIAIRIQTNGESDIPNVQAIQDKVVISEYNGGVRGQFLTPDWGRIPSEEVINMSAEVYLTTLANLLKYNPPSQEDGEMILKLKNVGIDINNLDAFNFSKLSFAEKLTLKTAVALAKKAFLVKSFINKTINGWVVHRDVGTYGNRYLIRAGIAYYGLGANLAVDAIYPTADDDVDGNQLTGKNKYKIHFEKNQIPPVNAFWSITMYNHESFLVANKLNKYIVRDRDNLVYNEDGSLDIFIQKDSPGEGLESNWLPAPVGEFNLSMRLYWPKEEAINGTWNPTPIIRYK
jgi:hypothetical protein